MKAISTGTGLAILGSCILAAAVMSSPFGKFAIAAGGGQTPSVSPRLAQLPKANIGGAAGFTDCEVRVEHWFNPVPHIVQSSSCVDPNSGLWEEMQAIKIYQPVDLLGDGKVRRLAVFGIGWFTDQTRIDVMEFRTQPDGSTSPSRIRILSSEDAELFGNLADLGVASIYDLDSGNGWADMDGDGDLDLSMNVWGRSGNMTVWIENIAGGTASASPYDLDHDGHVNTGDLSLLLMEFTD